MRGSRIWYQPWKRNIEPPKQKHEQGWHAFHYLESGCDSVDISIDVFDGSDSVELGGKPGEFPSMKVSPQPNWTLKEKYARTILEMAQLAAALLIPLAAFASSTVNGGGEGRWWTLVGLGFGTDTIKNIITGKDDSPATPLAK
jgi:hypothetical protein